MRRWTRTVSVATSAAWSKPIAKSRGVWESCPNRCRARTRVRCWCGEFHLSCFDKLSMRDCVDSGLNEALTVSLSKGEGRQTRNRSKMKARVFVTLKNGVLDPQGKAIGTALHGLGFVALFQFEINDLALAHIADGAEAEAV